ncbi:zinc-dependent peptidase [Pirellulaceae bacterium SH467]
MVFQWLAFQWLFGGRRRITQAPITQDERELLRLSLWQSVHLPDESRDKLIRWCRVFIREKNWEGCNGLTVTPEIQWSIASAAGLMVLHYDGWYFDRTQTVLVYPAPYVAREEGHSSLLNTTIPAIMGEFPRAGQTIYRGPVVVNWQDIQDDRRSGDSGDHLVIHEFAHQLDLINSPFADGLPPLPDEIDEDRWRQQMTGEFEEARRLVERGYDVLIDDYGLTSESEFFAVASEHYFQIPHELAEFHPGVYKLLQQFYRIDLRGFIPIAH